MATPRFFGQALAGKFGKDTGELLLWFQNQLP
jgi:hypothetical protein